jgi:hypothetical protein
MDIFKVCQPCRAYSLNQISESNSNGQEDEDKHRRWLENDGEGEAEQYGYNCYDDAGYTNVNQCYKFETKTDLTQILEESVAMASDTIVTIQINGTVYGSGGFASEAYSNLWFSAYHVVVLLTMGTFLLSMSFILYAYFELSRRRKRRRNNMLDASAQQHFLQDTMSWEFRKGSLVDRLADLGEVVFKLCNDVDMNDQGDGSGSLTTAPTDRTFAYSTGSSLGEDKEELAMDLPVNKDKSAATSKNEVFTSTIPSNPVVVDWNDVSDNKQSIGNDIWLDDQKSHSEAESSFDVDNRWETLRSKILDDGPVLYSSMEDEDDEGYMTAKESVSSSYNDHPSG